MEPSNSEEIDNYIRKFNANTQLILNQLRNTIKEAAPNATEVISYGMPAFQLDKIIVYYAAYQNHIGFYPTSSAIEKFKDQLSTFHWSKGAIQFSLQKPLPITLITSIVKYKVDEISNVKN